MNTITTNVRMLLLPSSSLAPPPPREVGVFNVSFSTTTVCWKAPTQNSVRQFVLKYAPTHKTLSTSNQTLVVPFLSGQQLYCSELNGLEENTRYRVLVVAANSVGKSEPVRLRFRTAIHGEYVCMLLAAATI